MFRNNLSQPKADQFDLARIQQQIATINFLAETLKLSSKHESVHLHVDVLMKAIKKFEAKRFTDYAFNKTKRASSVLKELNMYKALHKDILKNSGSYFISKALKTSLTTYSHSVESAVATIQQDLKASLTKQHRANALNQESALLDKELDLLGQASAAFYLEYSQLENIDDLNTAAARIAEQLEFERNARLQTEYETSYQTMLDERELAEDAEYSYYSVEDMEISEEDRLQKPHLMGNFNFTESELAWLLGGNSEAEENSDTDIISDTGIDFEIDSDSIIESPSPIAKRHPHQFFADADSDAEADCSDDDIELENSRSPMLRF